MSQIIDEIRSFNLERVIRPTYGDTSLKNWEPGFKKILHKLDIIEKYWDEMDTDSNNRVENALKTILGELRQMASNDEALYVSDKDGFANRMNQQFHMIKQNYPKYAIEALDRVGLLENLNIGERLKEISANLEVVSRDTLSKIRSESEKIITSANNRADQINSELIKTAKHISVKEAQDQFQEGATQNMKNIKIWGSITVSLIFVFCIAIYCMLKIETSDEITWKVIYHSALRIAILGFIGTLLAFSLKILKSHLHMREHNLHRKRIANSMAAFAESASSQDQKDLILSRLVDSVSTFGNSGMISNDEDVSSKITIDNISRTLGALKPN